MPYLKASLRASILALTGMRARAPLPAGIIAGAMNAASENGMKALALDLAEVGIRVLCISPGPFDTPRLNNIFQRYGTSSGSAPETLAAAERQRVPMRRFGSPEELARLVRFVVSGQVPYMSGTTLAIDGGAAPGV